MLPPLPESSSTSLYAQLAQKKKQLKEQIEIYLTDQPNGPFCRCPYVKHSTEESRIRH